MKKFFPRFLCLAFLFWEGLACFAFEIRTSESASDPFAPFTGLKIGGEVSAELKGFVDEFRESKAAQIQPGDIFSGALNFGAYGSRAAGFLDLKFAPVFGGGSQVSLDQAYLRAFFRGIVVEGGLRKLTWGKADRFGPLDVVNPLDYSDLSALADNKIARPLLRFSWGLGSFTNLEAVFVPTFEGHRYATEGRWAPGQAAAFQAGLEKAVGAYIGAIQAGLIPPGTDMTPFADQKKIVGYYQNLSIGSLYPQTNTLKYAQGGLRFTTSLGPAALGVQYFYGNLFRPAVSVRGLDTFFQNPYLDVQVNYNRYHQIGLDYAQAIGSFNLRAEATVHITEDIQGTDGEIINPFAGWSLGFDRNLFGGIYLNLMGTGTVRLLHDKLGDNPLTDAEAGKDMTATRIVLLLSKKILNDELELKLTGLWGIEDRDVYILPALIWNWEELSLELSGGIFAGEKTGELGYYRDNSFVKALLKYSF